MGIKHIKLLVGYFKYLNFEIFSGNTVIIYEIFIGNAYQAMANNQSPRKNIFLGIT